MSFIRWVNGELLKTQCEEGISIELPQTALQEQTQAIMGLLHLELFMENRTNVIVQKQHAHQYKRMPQ